MTVVTIFISSELRCIMLIFSNVLLYFKWCNSLNEIIIFEYCCNQSVCLLCTIKYSWTTKLNERASGLIKIEFTAVSGTLLSSYWEDYIGVKETKLGESTNYLNLTYFELLNIIPSPNLICFLFYEYKQIQFNCYYKKVASCIKVSHLLRKLIFFRFCNSTVAPVIALFF